MFSTETSVLREALDDFYSKRKKAKYESYEVEKEIEILKWKFYSSSISLNLE